MKRGAKFIGIDWFSTAHSDAALGSPAGDANTRKDIPSGQFAGVGRVHFSDEMHLRDLFSGFTLDSLEHKRVDRTLPPPASTFASWNLVAARGAD
jgi:hypothetical protein